MVSTFLLLLLRTLCISDLHYLNFSLATAIMQQYEEGKIDLDEDISTYLGYEMRNPNFPNIPISTRSLMTHQSSLANPTNLEASDIVAVFTDSVFNMADWVKDYMIPGESKYTPGVWKNYSPDTQHSNSNLGVTILAHLVEKVSGMNFRDYAKRIHFFKAWNVNDSLQNELS